MTNHHEALDSDRLLVETDWLEAILDAPDLRILDCTVFLTTDPAGDTRVESGHAKWQEAHIPGSGFADVLGALSDPDAEYRCTLPRADRFAEAMSALGVGDETRVVLYCAGGPAFGTRVWWMLRAFGFESAAILNGGLAKWTQEGRPLTDAPTSHPTAEFKVRERPELFVDKAHMVAAVAAGDACIINALSKEQHTGSGGPNYGRPGRIPGTSCVPAMSLVDPETAAYRPLAELRAAFAEVGALDAERVITYCGGGIAASSDAFVLNMLGVDGVSIYDGSLREWVADLELPMETG